MRSLRDMVAEAIRGDGTDLCDRPWDQLPKEIKEGWLGDADRAINCIVANIGNAPVIEVVRDTDGAHSLYLNDHRIAGGKPNAGRTTVNKWCVRRADLIAALGLSKRAVRPSGDLRDYGYAPGDYQPRCSTCRKTFAGGKRAWTCKPCAESAARAAIAAADGAA